MTTLQKTSPEPSRPSVHLFTRDEYHDVTTLRLFKDRRVELLEGWVIDMSPMGTKHSVGTVLVGDALRRVFGNAFHIRTQMSLGLSEISEPEPDVAVIRGLPREYLVDHPGTAELIVEVADTSLTYDREDKAAAYAKAGIADYWILNVVDGQLEVYRDPVPDAASATGFAYASVTFHDQGKSVSPLRAPEAIVAISELLPSL